MQATDLVQYEAVIGLEVHAELETASKMFCSCAVVDTTTTQPNSSVCPVCAGMPGTLPVVNLRAVEYGLRVALALECEINLTSIFARKNYFYPDLPKGYQISQYEQPLARHGKISIYPAAEERVIRVRRVHLEEDTGKLTHLNENGKNYSLVDLNRAGVPLLEIVSEPDLHSAEDVRTYAEALRSLLRYLMVNSGDMQKGVLRVEPNISVRPVNSQVFGTRVEIKNLNSFRALERSVTYEIERQSALLRIGGSVLQETRGWDETLNRTFTQRVKEGEEDYRYFPEPDLPPLMIEPEWLKVIQRDLPELPRAKLRRFEREYGLTNYDASVLTAEAETADYFEKTIRYAHAATPKQVANWINGDLFSLLHQHTLAIRESPITPVALAGLVELVAGGIINQNTAKKVLDEMFSSGKPASEIVAERGLIQLSDQQLITQLVAKTLDSCSLQVQTYLDGKETIGNWLFGQVMRTTQGKANPQLLRQELDRQLGDLKAKKE